MQCVHMEVLCTLCEFVSEIIRYVAMGVVVWEQGSQNIFKIDTYVYTESPDHPGIQI